MNEQILKLAKQSGLLGRKFMFGQYYDDELTDEQLKFAELIVRECVSICWAESRTAGANGDLAEYGALSRAGGNIKEHFGVE